MSRCDNGTFVMNVDPYFHSTPLDVSNSCNSGLAKRVKDADIFFDVYYCGNHLGLVTSLSMFVLKSKVEKAHNDTLSLHIFTQKSGQVLFLGYKIFDSNLYQLFRAEIFRS